MVLVGAGRPRLIIKCCVTLRLITKYGSNSDNHAILQCVITHDGLGACTRTLNRSSESAEARDEPEEHQRDIDLYLFYARAVAAKARWSGRHRLCAVGDARPKAQLS